MPLSATLPSPRVPDPATAPVLRWGVMGTGWIAERFVTAVRRLTRQDVSAVGSRDRRTADFFADRFGIARRYGSYADLVADPQLDVIYVATPHNAHLPCAELVLQAGKAVLVEKPLALNAGQARRLADVAAASGLFCMEALWTFFLPKFDVIRQVLDDGLLGTVHTVLADNGEWFPAGHRIFDASLAGGPMLDLGTYPVSLAVRILGEADGVLADGTWLPTGVHAQVGALLRHGSARSVVHTTLLGNTATTAVLSGDAATLTIPGAFYRPGPFVLAAADASATLTYREPAVGYDGLAFQVAETARRIVAGDRGSPVRPLADSIATLAAMDAIRAQLEIVFPGETACGTPTDADTGAAVH